MKSLVVFACALPLSVMTALAQNEKPAAKAASSEYAGLRDRVKSGDLSVDFKRLRISFVDSPEYRAAKDTDQAKTAMFKALNAHDFKKATQNADVVLENNYTNMDAHFAESIAYRELGDAGKADFHHAVFDGLIKSILNSGDGKSKATAYVVASVDEEYVVLRVLGLRPNKQSLAHDQGHSYDVLEANDATTGKTVTLYFNADVPMNHLMNIFGDKK